MSASLTTRASASRWSSRRRSYCDQGRSRTRSRSRLMRLRQAASLRSSLRRNSSRGPFVLDPADAQLPHRAHLAVEPLDPGGEVHRPVEPERRLPGAAGAVDHPDPGRRDRRCRRRRRRRAARPAAPGRATNCSKVTNSTASPTRERRGRSAAGRPARAAPASAPGRRSAAAAWSARPSVGRLAPLGRLDDEPREVAGVRGRGHERGKLEQPLVPPASVSSPPARSSRSSASTSVGSPRSATRERGRVDEAVALAVEVLRLRGRSP